MINKIKLQNKVMQRFISNAKNECKDCSQSLEHCTCIENTINFKQETLEEAKQNYLNKCVKEVRYTGYCDEDFEQGAKFQQEQDKSKYSEEEVLELLNNYHRAAFAYTKASSASPKEWFENFKKK